MNIKSYYTNTSVFKMNVYLDFMKIPIRFMCVFGNTNTLLFHLKGQLLNISGFVANTYHYYYTLHYSYTCDTEVIIKKAWRKYFSYLFY
jgi:hypothetical protein